MNQFRIVSTILVVCISSTFAQGTCPNGVQSTKYCSMGRCTIGSICYRKDKERLCCGQLDRLCPTEMLAFNSEEGYSYLWGPSGSTLKEEWYSVGIGYEVIACPIPFSYAYSENTLTVLPVDFDTSNKEKSKPNACNSNSDCKMNSDEFCGAAYHPTFSPKLDGSGTDNAPLRFCYKFLNLGSKNVKPVIAANKTELTLCDNNTDCLIAETFCLTTEKPLHFGLSSRQGFCAFNPKSGAIWWWYILAVSIVSTVAFLGLSIDFYILHRKRVLKAKEAGPTTYDPDAPKTSAKETTITSSDNDFSSNK